MPAQLLTHLHWIHAQQVSVKHDIVAMKERIRIDTEEKGENDLNLSAERAFDVDTCLAYAVAEVEQSLNTINQVLDILNNKCVEVSNVG